MVLMFLSPLVSFCREKESLLPASPRDLEPKMITGLCGSFCHLSRGHRTEQPPPHVSIAKCPWSRPSRLKSHLLLFLYNSHHLVTPQFLVGRKHQTTNHRYFPNFISTRKFKLLPPAQLLTNGQKESLGLHHILLPFSPHHLMNYSGKFREVVTGEVKTDSVG